MSKKETTALAVVDPPRAPVVASGIPLRTFDEFERFAMMCFHAGIVGKNENAQQAVAKAIVAMQYGMELGVGPMTAVSSIHVANGKPAMSAQLMAAQIRGSGSKDLTIKRLDERGCVLEFRQRTSEGWIKMGESSFTLEDAQKAGLTSGKNAATWKSYPRNMLFARALSNGARWYCSEIFRGPVYTPEELGGDSALALAPGEHAALQEEIASAPPALEAHAPEPEKPKAQSKGEPATPEQRQRLSELEQHPLASEKMAAGLRKLLASEKLAHDLAQRSIEKAEALINQLSAEADAKELEGDDEDPGEPPLEDEGR